jgi:hypothetical protein
MSLENHLERIDFSRSTIYWDGPSKGIFKLVSVLEVSQANFSKGETIFGLIVSNRILYKFGTPI